MSYRRSLKKFILIFFCAVTLVTTGAGLVSPATRVLRPASSFLSVPRAFAYNYGDTTVVTKVLTGEDTNGAWVQDLYKTCRDFLNLFLVAILLFVAFANILHINIETYTVKKILLPLIIVALFANIAMPLIALISKFVDTLQGVSIFKPMATGDWWGYIYRGSKSMFQHIGVLGAIAAIGAIIAGTFSGLSCVIGGLIIFAGIIISIALSLVLAVRPYVIFLAAAVSPLGIALYVLPQTQPYFKKWLGILITWTMMPLVIFAIVNLGDKITANWVPETGTGTLSGIVGWVLGVLLPSILRAGMLLLAIRFPFMIEKDLSKLVAISAKYTGKGIMMGGGSLGSKMFNKIKNRTRAIADLKRDKTIRGIRNNPARVDNRIGNKLRNAGYSAAEISNMMRYRSDIDAWRTSGMTSADQSRLSKAYSAAEIQTEEDYQQYANKRAKDAGGKYRDHWWTKTQSVVGSTLSLPLGVVVGVKKGFETRKGLIERDSSKNLANFWQEAGAYNYLEKRQQAAASRTTSSRTARWLSDREASIYGQLIARTGAAGVMGEATTLEHHKGRAVSDMGNLDSRMVTETIAPIIAKVKKNLIKMGIPLDEVDTALKSITDNLIQNAESLGAWKNSPISKGLTHEDVSYLATGLEFLRREKMKEARAPGGVSTAKIRNFEADRAITSIFTTIRPAPGGVPIMQLDQRTQRYLMTIARNTGTGMRGISEAVLAAGEAGIGPDQAPDLEGMSVDVLQETGLPADQMRSLREAPPQMLGGLINSLKQSNPASSQKLDEYQNLRNAHLGALGASENALSIDRIAVELAPKVNTAELKQQLSAACETTMKYNLKIDTSISPAAFQQAASLIKSHFPSGVLQKESGELNIDALTAAKIGRAVETLG